MKTCDRKETDGRRLPVYTPGLNCRAVTNPHTHTHRHSRQRPSPLHPLSGMEWGGRRDWPMSRESQELLVSIYGLSAVVVKCGRNDLAGGVSELGDNAVASLQQLWRLTFNIDLCPPIRLPLSLPAGSPGHCAAPDRFSSVFFSCTDANSRQLCGITYARVCIETRVCVHAISVRKKNVTHSVSPPPLQHHRPRLIKLAVLAIALKKWANRRNDDSSTCNYAGLLSHYTHCIWLPASSLSYIICAKPTQLSLPALWTEAEKQSELAAFHQGRPGGRLTVLFFCLCCCSLVVWQICVGGAEWGVHIGHRGKGGRTNKQYTCMMRWLTRACMCDGGNGDDPNVICMMVNFFFF